MPPNDKQYGFLRRSGRKQSGVTAKAIVKDVEDVFASGSTLIAPAS